MDLAGLDARDLATLAVSVTALIVSLTSLWHTITSKRHETERSAQTRFSEIIEAMVDLQEKRNELQRELGKEYYSLANSSMRVNLSDKRQLLISRALQLLNAHRLSPSDSQYMVIGAALANAGRYAEAALYYRKGIEVAATDLDRASLQRGYGHALILSGELNRGRAELIAAADTFRSLEAHAGLNPDRMRYEQADVFHRLLLAQLDQGGQCDESDYKALVEITQKLERTHQRQAMLDSIADIDKRRAA
jgi:tetratricopeptide (TPR) repeat protein